LKVTAKKLESSLAAQKLNFYLYL